MKPNTLETYLKLREVLTSQVLPPFIHTVNSKLARGSFFLSRFAFMEKSIHLCKKILRLFLFSLLLQLSTQTNQKTEKQKPTACGGISLF